MAFRFSCGFLVLALVSVGCKAPLRSADTAAGDRPLPPTLERLRKAYPDLAGGKFLCLADFNAPGQELLLRVLGPTGEPADRAQPVISTSLARDETGPGGLEATLSSAADRLIFDGARAAESPQHSALTLIRDWSGYSLLMFSAFGPPDGVAVELSIMAGEDLSQRWTRVLFLRPRWGTYRVDLAEVGEQVDLRDVRAVAWQAIGLQAPLRLALDDILIVENTRELQRAAADKPGALYAFTQGKRLQVGATGRFELGIADGVIAAWTDLVEPRRNLAVRGGVGPWPVPLAEGWQTQRESPPAYDDPALYQRWGALAGSQQQVLEMTPFRAVVRGAWRFSPGASPSDVASPESLPGHVWTYTIYSSGEIFINVKSSPAAGEWRGPVVAYAVAVSGRAEFSRVDPPAASESPFVLWSRRGTGAGDLLWVPATPASATHRMELASADGASLAMLLGDVDALRTVETAHLFRVWPTDLNSAAEAGSIASDYQRPATISPTVGRVVRDAVGDLNGDGFNESEGCYELLPDRDLLRFAFDPGARLRHHPIFRVRETAGREAWVYCDGRILRDIGRDAAGNVMFALDHPATTTVRFDVNLKSAAR